MKIKSINPISYNGYTYNLHIKNNHNYFANGLNVSNCHKSSSNGIQNILKCSVNSKFKIGLTGSLSDNILDNLKIEGAIGEVEKIIGMREMIDLGLASEIVIKPIFIEYSSETRKEIKKMNYQEEDKFIRNNVERAKFIARLINSLSPGNSITIYKNIDCAELILKELVALKDPNKEFNIKDYRKQNDLKVYYSQGATKSKERNNFRKYLEDTNGCSLLGTQQIIATGTNIKNLPYSIFENIGKSSTLTIQGLGRGARLHKNKSKSIVFDIVDDARYYTKKGREYPNYKFKHWIERLDIYYSEEYIVDEPIKFKLISDII
jgi:superfamily II DNA or RNA helicase